MRQSTWVNMTPKQFDSLCQKVLRDRKAGKKWGEIAKKHNLTVSQWSYVRNEIRRLDRSVIRRYRRSA